jgi:hypothetical protein
MDLDPVVPLRCFDRYVTTRQVALDELPRPFRLRSVISSAAGFDDDRIAGPERPSAISETNAQDLKRFGKNTKDNLGSMSLAFDAVLSLQARSQAVSEMRSET